jgi:putative acetyltransferase
MIRAFEPDDADDVIRVWIASTIPGQSFLPEEHWRAMEPAIREDLMPIAETWVVEEDGELVAFMSLLDDLIGGLFTHPDHQGKGHG